MECLISQIHKVFFPSCSEWKIKDIKMDGGVIPDFKRKLHFNGENSYHEQDALPNSIKF